MVCHFPLGYVHSTPVSRKLGCQVLWAYSKGQVANKSRANRADKGRGCRKDTVVLKPRQLCDTSPAAGRSPSSARWSSCSVLIRATSFRGSWSSSRCNICLSAGSACATLALWEQLGITGAPYGWVAGFWKRTECCLCRIWAEKYHCRIQPHFCQATPFGNRMC